MSNGVLALLAALTIAPVLFAEAQTRSPFEPPPMEQPPMQFPTGSAGTLAPPDGAAGGGAPGSGGAGGSSGGAAGAEGDTSSSDRAGVTGGSGPPRAPSDSTSPKHSDDPTSPTSPILRS